MRQAGRYLPEYREVRAQADGFLGLCYTPELATEVTLQPIRRYGFDAAIVFSDILVVPHALGQAVDYVEGEGPKLPPIRQASDLDGLESARLPATLAPVYDTISAVRRGLPDDVALIGFAGAPWTIACYMVEGGTSKDFMAVKSWAFGDPSGFGRLIDMLVHSTAEHLIRQARAGAEALQIFDSWAGVLPDWAFRKWVIEPIRRVVDLVRRAEPTVPIIGFPRGAGVMYEAFVAKSGVDAVSVDSMVPPSWAADILQRKVPVQGNLDPALIVAGGDEMRRQTMAVMRGFSTGPHIFNLGHGVNQFTPPDHVAELVSLVRGGAAVQRG